MQEVSFDKIKKPHVFLDEKLKRQQSCQQFINASVYSFINLLCLCKVKITKITSVRGTTLLLHLLFLLTTRIFQLISILPQFIDDHRPELNKE